MTEMLPLMLKMENRKRALLIAGAAVCSKNARVCGGAAYPTGDSECIVAHGAARAQNRVNRF